MGIRIAAYSPSHEPAVAEFNRRLAAADWPQRFPERSKPGWLPREDDPELFNEIFVAVDSNGDIRGGYTLKHQQFCVAGQVRSLANYAFPLSEGVVNRRFGLVGVSMILDAEKRNPLLFGLGMGSEDHPSVRVMKGVGWGAVPVPFLFRVMHPYRFLRGIAHLRSSLFRRLLLDFAAVSGAGWLAVRLARVPALMSAASGGQRRAIRAFGPWADQIWEASRWPRGLAAVRDSRSLNGIYPPHVDRYVVLEVRDDEQIVGWAVCLATQMRGNSYFGNLRVGTIVDCFALPGKESLVIAAADAELVSRGVDVAISNQANRDWCRALVEAGYREGPSNFVFTCSRALAALLEPLASNLGESHINRGDGDGPIHL